MINFNPGDTEKNVLIPGIVPQAYSKAMSYYEEILLLRSSITDVVNQINNEITRIDGKIDTQVSGILAKLNAEVGRLDGLIATIQEKDIAQDNAITAIELDVADIKNNIVQINQDITKLNQDIAGLIDADTAQNLRIDTVQTATDANTSAVAQLQIDVNTNSDLINANTDAINSANENITILNRTQSEQDENITFAQAGIRQAGMDIEQIQFLTFKQKTIFIDCSPLPTAIDNDFREQYMILSQNTHFINLPRAGFRAGATEEYPLAESTVPATYPAPGKTVPDALKDYTATIDKWEKANTQKIIVYASAVGDMSVVFNQDNGDIGRLTGRIRGFINFVKTNYPNARIVFIPVMTNNPEKIIKSPQNSETVYSTLAALRELKNEGYSFSCGFELAHCLFNSGVNANSTSLYINASSALTKETAEIIFNYTEYGKIPYNICTDDSGIVTAIKSGNMLNWRGDIVLDDASLETNTLNIFTEFSPVPRTTRDTITFPVFYYSQGDSTHARSIGVGSLSIAYNTDNILDIMIMSGTGNPIYGNTTIYVDHSFTLL